MPQLFTFSAANLTIRNCIYIFVVYLVYRLFLYPYFLSPLRSVPGPSIGHPILGRLLTFHGERIGIPQRQWFRKYGPVVRVMAPIGMERLLILDHEVASEILVKNWKAYPRGTYINKLLELIAGRGLLTLHGDEHQHIRKAMNPAFSLSSLSSQSEMYHAPIQSFVDVLSARLKQDGSDVIHMYDLLSKVTLDILCETAFGYRSNSICDSSNELSVAYENILRIQTASNMAVFFLFAHIPGGIWLMSSEWAYQHRAWYRYTGVGFFDDVATLLESMNTKDIMSELVRARQDDADFALTDEGLMDQVLTFLIGGHETISSGLSWTLWLLATHKDCQDRLREEVLSAFIPFKPDYKQLKSLPFLDCVIMESLRLMSPIPIISRMARETCTIKGMAIPKGTFMHICIRNINTSEDLWGEDAENFRPERWLNLPDTYHPTFSRITFSTGPRNCIGKNMAILEMKAILTSLITKFEFSPAYQGQTPKADHIISYKPVDGLPLKVRAIA
ncbi:cytochrome P450 [Hymenopellis radicata]|nr:cytochrome P450 [Hymenopellis radicata]